MVLSMESRKYDLIQSLLTVAGVSSAFLFELVPGGYKWIAIVIALACGAVALVMYFSRPDLNGNDHSHNGESTALPVLSGRYVDYSRSQVSSDASSGTPDPVHVLISASWARSQDQAIRESLDRIEARSRELNWPILIKSIAEVDASIGYADAFKNYVEAQQGLVQKAYLDALEGTAGLLSDRFVRIVTDQQDLRVRTAVPRTRAWKEKHAARPHRHWQISTKAYS